MRVAAMVLRGTKVSPDDGYLHAKHQVAEAREQYDMAHSRLKEAEQAVEAFGESLEELHCTAKSIAKES